jgi:hypothetical protein
MSDNKGALFLDKLPPEVAANTTMLKTKFDAGLRDYGGATRELPYLYERNIALLRSHLLEEETFRFVFPFNGKLSLKSEAGLVGKLPYMTQKCGYQDQGGNVINYYCPALDEAFFEYLDELAPSSELIGQFVAEYREFKTITPDLRYNMLMSGSEKLDFSSPDHQLFYALFQLWAYDDMKALEAVKG